MKPISIEKFVDDYSLNNKGVNKKDITSRLEITLRRKLNGAICIHCGSPIWAIGSAIIEWDGCFSCITGEADDSDDYEVAFGTSQTKKQTSSEFKNQICPSCHRKAKQQFLDLFHCKCGLSFIKKGSRWHSFQREGNMVFKQTKNKPKKAIVEFKKGEFK